MSGVRREMADWYCRACGEQTVTLARYGRYVGVHRTMKLSTTVESGKRVRNAATDFGDHGVGKERLRVLGDSCDPKGIEHAENPRGVVGWVLEEVEQSASRIAELGQIVHLWAVRCGVYVTVRPGVCLHQPNDISVGCGAC